ncbi:hypothetical protein [Streptomyces fructofermentans]|nr:hypothetical protein [Streptomyces fructofermentans]
MQDQHRSATYHLARHDKIPIGSLVHVEDYKGERADIFLHKDHADSRLRAEFNHITSHQIGHGMWRQRWTHEGRMQQPSEGLEIAVSRWEIIPAHRMPSGTILMTVEEKGLCVWLIREGYCTRALRDEMNRMLGRIAGDGLWIQDWYDYDEALLTSPLIPVCL